MTDGGELGLSRRELFRHTRGAVALVAVARLPRTPTRSSRPPGLPTLADIQPYVGSPFEVGLDRGRTVTVTLVDATKLAAQGQGGHPVTGEAYSLLFATGRGTDLPSGTYSFNHGALGRFSLFVAPVGAGQNGPRIEAVVNSHSLAR